MYEYGPCIARKPCGFTRGKKRHTQKDSFDQFCHGWKFTANYLSHPGYLSLLLLMSDKKNVCIQCYVVIVKEYSSVHNRPQSRHESVCFARLCLLIRARVCVGVSIYAHDGDVASVCSLLITAISMRSVQCSGNRARAHVLSFALRSPIYTYNKYTTCVFLCKTERDKCIRAACLLLDCVTINNSESNNNSNSSNKPFIVQRKQQSHSIKLKAKPKQTTSTTTTPKEITARQRSVYVVLVQQ